MASSVSLFLNQICSEGAIIPSIEEGSETLRAPPSRNFEKSVLCQLGTGTSSFVPGSF
ncbi:hypothetical protein F2Q68_00038826 [Brassica cretica]|uniref:Uncharacterized protein n=1 Tax=Brassica cretica TaxID=69181 RepID=A0A8S9MCE8_BRACR|nr:hypothetical protein F2Q68_00038826 [Brassica cretica]